MTHPESLRELMNIAETPVKFLSTIPTIKSVSRAKWAVDEIRRLRARVNQLIKIINDADTYGNHMHSDKDLIEEQEI